ncbi:hypothetical protein HDU76_008994, partial [Blyttiomyces sp. JEL0837]
GPHHNAPINAGPFLGSVDTTLTHCRATARFEDAKQLSRPPDQFIEKELGHSFRGDFTGHQDWAEKKVRSSRAFDSFVDTLRQHYPENKGQGPQVAQKIIQTTGLAQGPTQDHRGPVNVCTSIHQTFDSISLAAALVKKNVTKGGLKATTSSKEKMTVVKASPSPPKLDTIGKVSISKLTPPHSPPWSSIQEQSNYQGKNEALATANSTPNKKEIISLAAHEKIQRLLGETSVIRDAENTLQGELNHEKSKRASAASGKQESPLQANTNTKPKSTTEQMHIDVPVAEANRHLQSHIPKAVVVMTTEPETNKNTDRNSGISAGIDLVSLSKSHDIEMGELEPPAQSRGSAETVAPSVPSQAQIHKFDQWRQPLPPTHESVATSKFEDVEMEESDQPAQNKYLAYLISNKIMISWYRRDMSLWFNVSMNQASHIWDQRRLRYELLEHGYCPHDGTLIFLGEEFVHRISCIVSESNGIMSQIEHHGMLAGVDGSEIQRSCLLEAERKFATVEALIAEFMVRYEQYRHGFGGGTPPHGQGSNAFHQGTALNYGHGGNAVYSHGHAYATHSRGNGGIPSFYHQEPTGQHYHGHEPSLACNNQIAAGGIYHSTGSTETQFSPMTSNSHANIVPAFQAQVPNVTAMNRFSNGDRRHSAMDDLTNALQNVSVTSGGLQSMSVNSAPQHSKVLTPVYSTPNVVVSQQGGGQKNIQKKKAWSAKELQSLAKDGVLTLYNDDVDDLAASFKITSFGMAASDGIKKFDTKKAKPKLEAARQMSLEFKESRIVTPLTEFSKYLAQSYFGERAEEFKNNVKSLNEMEGIVSRMEKDIEEKKVELLEEERVWRDR